MLDFDQLPLFKKNAVRIFVLIDQWALAFEVRREDILRQLPIAHAWITANPERAPKKNVTRFLHSWMARAKEFGNLKARVQMPKVNLDPPEDLGTMTLEEMRQIRRQNMKGHP